MTIRAATWTLAIVASLLFWAIIGATIALIVQ
jgi:hypothetical protein